MLRDYGIGFNKKSIRRKVMAVIDKKIEEAQKTHDVAVDNLDKVYEKDLFDLDRKLVKDKEAALETQVQNILAKIL